MLECIISQRSETEKFFEERLGCIRLFENGLLHKTFLATKYCRLFRFIQSQVDSYKLRLFQVSLQFVTDSIMERSRIWTYKFELIDLNLINLQKVKINNL